MSDVFFPLEIVVFLFFVAFSKAICLKEKTYRHKKPGRSEPRFGETFYVKINKDAVANKSEDVALGLMLKEAGCQASGSASSIASSHDEFPEFPCICIDVGKQTHLYMCLKNRCMIHK